MTTDSQDRRLDPGVTAVLDELERRKRLKLSPRNGAQLANRLGISKQAVSKWLRVPPDRVLDVEKVIGVSKHVQRPDVFGPPKPKHNGGKRVGRRSR